MRILHARTYVRIDDARGKGKYALAMAISTRRSARVHLSVLKNIRAYERTYVRYLRTYVRISTGTYVRFAALLGSVRALRAEKKGRTEHVRAHVRT